MPDCESGFSESQAELYHYGLAGLLSFFVLSLVRIVRNNVRTIKKLTKENAALTTCNITPAQEKTT